MKTLLILRHAKSSWKDESLTDFERPLNKRGLRDAPRIGRLLQDEGLVPDVIFSSSAQRAVETAQLVVEESEFAGELHRRDDLYLAPPAQYLSLLYNDGGDHASILLIGHNPGMQMLVSHLAGQSETMPTAALAWFELPIDDWSQLAANPTGNLRMVWRPKEID